MMNIDTHAMPDRILQTLPRLNERPRRRFLAIESKSLG
jgi:hypothetical protein